MHQFFSSCCSRGPSLSLNTYRRAYQEISLPDNSWMKWLLALWRHPRIAPSHETAGPNALSTAARGFSTAFSLHNAIPYGKRQGEQFAENLGYLNAGKEYRLAVSFLIFAPEEASSLVMVADVTLLMRFPKASLSPMTHLTWLMSKSLSALVDKSISKPFFSYAQTPTKDQGLSWKRIHQAGAFSTLHWNSIKERWMLRGWRKRKSVQWQ